MPTLQLPDAEIAYRDVGRGPVLLFVHGALVDGRLWSPVVDRLSATHRCVVPDWPLGSHRIPAPRADLTPPGVADLIEQFVEKLDLRDVTIVGNDTGGAITQVLCARRPERITRLVLTNCDALEVFPPPEFAYLRTIQRIPGLPWLIARLLLARPRLRRAPTAYGGLTTRPIDDALLRAWVEPSATRRAIRADLRRLLLSLDNRHTLAAAEGLAEWRRPALLVWGAADRFFTPALGERLAAAIPGARFRPVADAACYVAQDAPDALAREISAFTAGVSVAA